MKKIPFFALILVLALLITPSWGDVVEPGKKDVPLYYQISNINDYPGYVFLIHGVPYPSFEVLNSSEFKTYKLSKFNIYAVPRSEFNSDMLQEMNDSQILDFFQNNKQVIRSQLELYGNFKTFPKSYNLEKAVMVLEIDSIGPQKLLISKKEMKYYFKDGTYQTIDFQDQDHIPDPVTSPSIYEYLFYLGIPLLALVLVILIVRKRRSG